MLMSEAMQTAALFTVNIVLQILAVTLLPITQGFTRPVPAVFCLLALTGSMWCMSRMIYGGVGLSLLFPLVAATVPLAAVVIGVTFFGEAASPAKMALLTAAAGLVGLASRF